MKLTKLSAASLHGRPAWLSLRCRLMPAKARIDAGTASQLIPGVGRTISAKRERRRLAQNAGWRIAERSEAARARCAPYSAYGTHVARPAGARWANRCA